MCMTQHTIAALNRWNWEGDEIIHECIVPSSRPIAGVRKSEYDIDVREFLVTEKNEVMKRTIREHLKRYVHSLSWGNWQLFESRQTGSFDHRADVAAAYVYEQIRYRRSAERDPWRFPSETLTLRYGDCEDQSFLLASLLIASGISSYNVRVALGKVQYGKEEYDHVWVMYKNEAGLWMILEPLLQSEPDTHVTTTNRKRKNASRPAAEYQPYFLFNNDHLWAVKRPGKNLSFRTTMELRHTWKKFDPKFAGAIHQSILKEALSKDLLGQPASPAVVAFANVLNSYFHSILGNTIDNVDSPRKYNPLEHFDNSLIDDAWALVDQRLTQFDQDCSPLTFSLAAHAIADFYAHSSYAQFAPPDTNSPNPSPALTRYEPNSFETWRQNIAYTASSGFDLLNKKFSINTHHWQGKLSQRPGRWQGNILSGRYAQADDSDRPSPNIFSPAQIVGYFTESSCRGDWDSVAAIAKNKDIACAPHHNEIAIDEDSPNSLHKLYSNAADFRNQYTQRRNTAVLHVREAFFSHWTE
jgi:hypothetical protein